MSKQLKVDILLFNEVENVNQRVVLMMQSSL